MPTLLQKEKNNTLGFRAAVYVCVWKQSLSTYLSTLSLNDGSEEEAETSIL